MSIQSLNKLWRVAWVMLAMLHLPLPAPAITITPVVVIPTVESAAYADDMSGIRVVRNNASNRLETTCQSMQVFVPSVGFNAAKNGGRAFRVMTEEELAGAKLGQYADSPYMNPSQAGKKWVWQTEEQAAKWKALMERGGEKPVITEIPTKRPLDAYEAFPHETPPGPAYLVPIEELGPANPLKR